MADNPIRKAYNEADAKLASVLDFIREEFTGRDLPQPFYNNLAKALRGIDRARTALRNAGEITAPKR